MKKGKAIFNPEARSAIYNRNWQGGNADDLVSIDHPGHVMFQFDSDDLRFGSAATVLNNWSPYLTQSLEGADADLWTEEMLLGVTDRLRKGSFGVFSPLFRNTNDGDGFVVTRQLGNYPIKTAFGRREWKESFTYLVSRLKTIPRFIGPTSGEPNPIFGQTSIHTGGGEDIVMPGWLGNGIVDTGDGADIILSSPQIHAVSLYDVRFVDHIFSSDELFANHYVYYPSAYSTKETAYNPKGNLYKAGEGDDLIYYDSGVGEAFGEEGDDVFAPSFGSFNWAIDTLFQAPRLGPNYKLGSDKFDSNLTLDWATYAPYPGQQALLSPLKTFNRKRDFKDVPLDQTIGQSYGDTYGYSLQFDADIKGRGQMKYYVSTIKKESLNPLNSGLSKNAQGTVALDNQYFNVLGGQKLYGGNGNDIFYGLDPDFYQGYRTAGNGQGLRVAFNRGKDAEGRQVAQAVNPVEMYGGLGGDYFALGNPNNLSAADRTNNSRDYFYRISGNHDEFLSKNNAFFNAQPSPDVFEFNLSYEGENWTSSVSSESEEGGASASDVLNLAGASLSLIQSAAGAVKDTLPKIFPVLGLLGSAASLVGTSLGINPAKPKKEADEQKDYFRNPLGSWQQKTRIQDWDPSDAIMIRVDPPSQQTSASRWSGVSLKLEKATDSEGSALDINYESIGQNKKTLVRLEEFYAQPRQGLKNWYVGNFNTGSYEIINSDDIAFFGQLPFGTKLPGYPDQYNFQVEANERIFRWTDTELLNQGELEKRKTLSETLAVQLDTRSLGYYWDIKYNDPIVSPNAQDPNNPKLKDLTINQNSSKLWYRDAAQDGTWKNFTFADITSGNRDAVTAARRATPIWSQSQPNWVSPPDWNKPLPKLSSARQAVISPPAQTGPFNTNQQLLQLFNFRNRQLNHPRFIPLQTGDSQSDPVTPFGFSQGHQSGFDVGDPFINSALPSDLLMA